MGLIKAITDSIGGTFADQWKEIITVHAFDEHTAVSPGIVQESNNGRGVNTKGSAGVISNGSKIFIPENTAAFILVSLVSRKLLQNQVDMNIKMVRAVFLTVMD